MSRNKVGETRANIVVYLDSKVKEQLTELAKKCHKPLSRFVREELELIANKIKED